MRSGPSPQSGGVLEALCARTWEGVVEGLAACSAHSRDVCSLPEVGLASTKLLTVINPITIPSPPLPSPPLPSRVKW